MTQNTYIIYVFTFPTALLISLLPSTSLFFSHSLVLPPAAYLHRNHQLGERKALAEGKIAPADRRSPQVQAFFEVLMNGVFIKVLKGTCTW